MPAARRCCATSRRGSKRWGPIPPSTEPRHARRILLTGAAGFVGRAVARALAERGDDVVALVRDPARAGGIRELRAPRIELVADDLSDAERLAGHLRRVDAAVHAAGSYRIGIPAPDRPAMWDANVGTTTRMLEAAELASVPRLVHVSTINVYGNTRGKLVDEGYRRDPAEGYLSWYDETKHRAHELVEQRMRAGAPIVIVLPSQVYGPGDHSGFGEQLALAHAGRLRYRALDELRVGLVHVDDLAAGIVATLDRAPDGASYNLSGPATSLREAIAVAAALGGRRAPRIRVPNPVLRLFAPVGRLIGEPNAAEIYRAAAGVTYLATSARAGQELGWVARPLEAGLRDVFGAA